jgi:light-independent protochlorophyllide reductase subunit B
LQEDLKNFVDRASIISDCNVIFVDVDHYQVNEIQAADRTLEQVVQYYLEKYYRQETLDQFVTDAPSVNIIGILTLGFHN